MGTLNPTFTHSLTHLDGMFQSTSGSEGEERAAAAAVSTAEPGTGSRRTSMEPTPGGAETPTTAAEPRPTDTDRLSPAGDAASDTAAETADGKTDQEKESAKYIEKRGYIFATLCCVAFIWCMAYRD